METDKTTPEVIEKPIVPEDSAEHTTKEHVESPMDRMLNRYKGEVPAIKPAPKPIELKEEFLKDTKPEDIEKFKKMPLDENMRNTLIETYNNMNKYNRLQTERDIKIKELEKLAPADGGNVKQQEFIDGLKTDFKGTLDKYKDEFGLPDAESIVGQLARANDLAGKMITFQEKELVPKLEKKHKLEVGTFVYDPNEAHTPGTPSYEYRVNTEMQEKKYLQEQIDNEKNINDAEKRINDERANQILNLHKEFFPETEVKAGMSTEEIAKITEANQKSKDEYTAMLGQIDNMFIKMRETKSFTPDINPIAISNIFKGVFFDKLAQARVDKAVADVHAEYRQKGMYIPDNGKPPVTDFSKVSGKAPNTLTREQLDQLNPLQRSINRSLTRN